MLGRSPLLMLASSGVASGLTAGPVAEGSATASPEATTANVTTAATHNFLHKDTNSDDTFGFLYKDLIENPQTPALWIHAVTDSLDSLSNGHDDHSNGDVPPKRGEYTFQNILLQAGRKLTKAMLSEISKPGSLGTGDLLTDSEFIDPFNQDRFLAYHIGSKQHITNGSDDVKFDVPPEIFKSILTAAHKKDSFQCVKYTALKLLFLAARGCVQYDRSGPPFITKTLSLGEQYGLKESREEAEKNMEAVQALEDSSESEDTRKEDLTFYTMEIFLIDQILGFSAKLAALEATLPTSKIYGKEQYKGARGQMRERTVLTGYSEAYLEAKQALEEQITEDIPKIRKVHERIMDLTMDKGVESDDSGVDGSLKLPSNAYYFGYTCTDEPFAHMMEGRSNKANELAILNEPIRFIKKVPKMKYEEFFYLIDFILWNRKLLLGALSPATFEYSEQAFGPRSPVYKQYAALYSKIKEEGEINSGLLKEKGKMRKRQKLL